MKYLGLILDNRSSFNNAHARLYKLFYIFNKPSKRNIKNSPIVMHGSHLNNDKRFSLNLNLL